MGRFSSETLHSRRYDEEYIEIPVRDAARARQLIALRSQPEVATAIDILVGDIFSSEDGDDLGFSVAETLNDNVTQTDSKLREIAIACIERNFPEGVSGHFEVLVDRGDAVVVRPVLDPPRNGEMCLLLRFRDGLIVEMRDFVSADHALAYAGLQ